MGNTLSTKFSATIGVISGYGGEEMLKQFDMVEKKLLATMWQEEAEKEMNNSGIYISAIIHSSKALYSTDWGCPIGGEPTFTISGERNPEFCKDDKAWQNAVLNIIKNIKNRLKQSTVTVTFTHTNVYYLK